jgi:hypothetical protein
MAGRSQAVYAAICDAELICIPIKLVTVESSGLHADMYKTQSVYPTCT